MPLSVECLPVGWEACRLGGLPAGRPAGWLGGRRAGRPAGWEAGGLGGRRAGRPGFESSWGHTKIFKNGRSCCPAEQSATTGQSGRAKGRIQPAVSAPAA